MNSLFGDGDDEDQEETEVHEVVNEQNLDLDSLHNIDVDGKNKKRLRRAPLSVETSINSTQNEKQKLSFSKSIGLLSESKEYKAEIDEETNAYNDESCPILSCIDIIVNTIYEKNGDDWNLHGMSFPTYFRPQKSPPLDRDSSLIEQEPPMHKMLNLTLVHLSQAMFAKRTNRENLNILLIPMIIF